MPQSTTPTNVAHLRLDKMTRILDVASELRTRQEMVERELHLDAVKDDLRKRLLAGAKASRWAVWYFAGRWI